MFAWEQRKLLDLLSQPVSDGPHETPDLVEEGIPFISVDAIVDNKIDFNRKRGYITEEYDLECRKKYSPQRDDVYLVKSGATVGKVAIVETDERFNIWSPLAAMRTNKELMLPNYLYFYLQLKDVQDEIYEKSIGGTQPNLSMRVLEQFNIRVPHIDEQEKISDALNNLDNLITLHQRNIYTAPPYNPISWEQRKLSEVTESIKNGYTYKADGSRDHRYKITRIESISSGVINTEKLGSSDEVNENYKLADGDILFSHINSLPYIANTALYTADLGEIYHGMNLLNIRSKHEEIDSHFLLHLLKKESTRDWFRIIAKPAVNQASISTTEVGSFEFLIPRMEEQKKISSVLDNLDNLITLHRCVY